MSGSFSFSKYAGTAVSAAWTAGWIFCATFAAKHWMVSGNGDAIIILALTLLAVLGSCWMAWRAFPREASPAPTTTASDPEAWYRRVAGWLALVIWCAAALAFYVTIFSQVILGVRTEQIFGIAMMMFFSVPGQKVLFVPFTSLAMFLDYLTQIEDKTAPPTTPKPSVLPRAWQKLETPAAATNNVAREMSLFGALFTLLWVNWFVYFAFIFCQGGVAIGTLPSHDGFILASGRYHTTVSESVWLFNLFYGAATFLGTPAILLPFGAISFWVTRWEGVWYKKAGMGLFITIWCIGWFGGIGHDFFKSYTDWKSLKHPPAMQQSTQRSIGTGMGAK